MKKNAIICDDLSSPILKKAVAVLSAILLDYTFEYPMCKQNHTGVDNENHRAFQIGTKKSNEFIGKNSKSNLTKAEEYAITVENDNVVIEGFDENGVLYGCMDFYNKYIVKNEFVADDRYVVNIFENKLPDFSYSSYPAVKNRGIWTWGHVIYDYTKFIGNMVKLKMNTLIVWNDFVPVNAKEMVDYAHENGIKIIWGYAWGWDTDCTKFSEDSFENMPKNIFEKYEKEYAHLGGDGIYFQSFTELKTQKIGNKLIAEAVTDFVNDVSKLFYEKYPDMELQFGLHATSVNENLKFIEKIDPRIRIIWEDCGAFPYSYIPFDVENFNKTVEFVNKIAVLRGKNDSFGVVTKGLTKLDWFAFEHLEGSNFVGVSSKRMKRNRIERKSKMWKYFQAYWLANADKAFEAVKSLAEVKNGDLYITPLVEDGMFEENIMYPVAVFSEMLWDCSTPLKEMISEVALRDYVDFA